MVPMVEGVLMRRQSEFQPEFRDCANTANNLFFNILFRIKCDKIDAFIRMAIIVITQMI